MKKKLLILCAFFLIVVISLFTYRSIDINQANLVIPIKYQGSSILRDFNQTDTDKYQTASGNYDISTMASNITANLVSAFSNAATKPLPLVANWNAGILQNYNGFGPMDMINKLANGEHVLPSWILDPYYNDTIGLDYYENSIKKAAELGLPLVFILPSPESALINDDVYFTMNKENNPNVITANGTILPKLSPLGPNSLWYEVGGQWSTTSLMAQIQEWYPNPPLILFIDKDASNKLSWNELSNSSRYSSEYPIDKSDEFKKTLVNAKWIEKYRQLHKSFKEGFTKTAWKNNVKFVSRNQLAVNMGQTSDWASNATTTNLHANIWPYTTDAVNVDFDLDGNKTDSSQDAPHITANNLPFMLEEAKQINPNFNYQLSINADGKIDNLQRYRGYTQFALWFLRPSVIRQKTATTSKEDISPLFQEVIDSVELINYNPILADFWQNGKLVETGTSPLNKNIPTQYNTIPRWFLLNTDSTQTVWAFALVKGEEPNREWLVYVQSPEENLTDLSVTVPEYNNVKLNSTQEGMFYTINESNTSQAITQPTAKSTVQTVDNNTNPYLEEITLPECNANNPEVQFISTNNDWSYINDTDKTIFCVKPGDYSSNGNIKLTTSGTKDKKRYIVLDNGNDIHPGKLGKDQLAKIGFILQDTNYWVIDRMAYWESPSTLNPIQIKDSDFNIINRYYMDNVGNGIYLFNGSDNNTIQQCRIQREDISIFHDRAAIGLNSDSRYQEDAIINIKNTKIINNEIVNFVDGFQAIRTGWRNSNNERVATLHVNYEGTIIYGNQIHINSNVYTDCNGNHNSAGECAYAENALDLKAGSENNLNPMIISNNIMWGFKKSDITNSYLGDPGVAIPIHFNVKNVLFKNNIIFNSDLGIQISDPLLKVSYTVENLHLENNIITNIKTRYLTISNANNVSVQYNTFSTSQFNMKTNYWLFMEKSKNLKFAKNVISNILSGSVLLSNMDENCTYNENIFYKSDRGNLPQSGFKYSSTNPIETFSNINLNIDNFTKHSYQINLSTIDNKIE